MTRPLRIGTRASALARWQTDRIAAALSAQDPDVRCEPVPVTTRGDADRLTPIPALGEVGVFTQALEDALHSGAIDLAVHSLKDLPTTPSPGLTVVAICEREDARDVLVGRAGVGLGDLPPGASVGTSSLRRRAQLLALRRDLRPVPIRGNVDTRVRRTRDGSCDAVILAAAGLHRLGLAQAITEYLPLDVMLPAPGQGALAVQCRTDDANVRRQVARLDAPAVRAAVTAERAFLTALGGGCSAPIGAHAVVNGTVRLAGVVADPDGHHAIRVRGESGVDDPRAAGRHAAERALAAGAAALLP